MRRGRKSPQKCPPSPSICRDCHRRTSIPRYSYYKASRPRCRHCGGTLDYLGPLTVGPIVVRASTPDIPGQRKKPPKMRKKRPPPHRCKGCPGLARAGCVYCQKCRREGVAKACGLPKKPADLIAADNHMRAISQPLLGLPVPQ